MRPLAKRQIREHFGANRNSPTTIPDPAQNSPVENAVSELLGVMYTAGISQPREIVRHGQVNPHPGLANGRRSTDAIFYDPISPKGNDERHRERLPRTIQAATREPKRRQTSTGRQVTRAQAIEAVIRELAELSTRSR